MATTRPNLSELSDEALLDRFRTDAGDGADAALAELARRYEGPLLGLARGILGGREDLARDAVQETWIKVIRHAKGFEGRSSVKTWLYRVAINRARDLAASRMARPAPSAVVQTLESVSAAPHAEPGGDPEAVMALHAALARLAEPPRLILILCYHRGLTLAQAAEVLNIPLGTLKSRLHTALNELRATLSKEELS